MSYFFDIDRIIKLSGLSPKIIEEIKREVYQEFPHDEMMYELHVLRAIHAEKNPFTLHISSRHKIRS